MWTLLVYLGDENPRQRRHSGHQHRHQGQRQGEPDRDLLLARPHYQPVGEGTPFNFLLYVPTVDQAHLIQCEILSENEITENIPQYTDIFSDSVKKLAKLGRLLKVKNMIN